MYLDVFVFDLTIFLVNANRLWGASFNYPLIFNLVLNSVAAYI